MTPEHLCVCVVFVVHVPAICRSEVLAAETDVLTERDQRMSELLERMSRSPPGNQGNRESHASGRSFCQRLRCDQLSVSTYSTNICQLMAMQQLYIIALPFICQVKTGFTSFGVAMGPTTDTRPKGWEPPDLASRFVNVLTRRKEVGLL